ncbi:thiamine phosphate synthase [Effusibacillus dendaii]|uniref:Thiamine-phosphate synthase n=1 Tax=Effusibacillus dendaii TaxID=2743772 RepID=A0A7I8DAD4_9BACL|nr:thiamine phosphate synthase [Effusibacillus dendaii]BCJ85776.1 thiamine-phosphate synthase [Effusibacillus dendaii]
MDSRLYLITGTDFLKNRSLLDTVAAAIEGGADCVQLREKNASSRQLLQMAIDLRKLTAKYNVPLIVNDRVDIALAADADGVHLGQDDLPIDIARKMLGPNKIIGISTHNVEEAIEAERAGASYIGVGPFKPTSTKTDTQPVVGLAGIRQIRQAVSLPIVAIGGIQQPDVSDIIQSGANGVAVISAIMAADDVLAAASGIRAAVDRVRGGAAWN